VIPSSEGKTKGKNSVSIVVKYGTLSIIRTASAILANKKDYLAVPILTKAQGW
jgi:hypothetical protein